MKMVLIGGATRGIGKSRTVNFLKEFLKAQGKKVYSIKVSSFDDGDAALHSHPLPKQEEYYLRQDTEDTYFLVCHRSKLYEAFQKFLEEVGFLLPEILLIESNSLFPLITVDLSIYIQDEKNRSKPTGLIAESLAQKVIRGPVTEEVLRAFSQDKTILELL